ncbi:unnamed protein product [Rhodiola kirilowii]
MARLGRRSVFADSDEEEEDGYEGGDLEEEDILWSYGIGQRSGRSGGLRAESNFPTHDSVDHFKPEVVCAKHKTYSNSMLIPIVDHKLDKYVGKVLQAVESLSLRLSKMDLRSSQLEASVDQLNGSFHWQHQRTHEKLRQLEDIMKEVQGAVKDLKDKYEIAEGQNELAKLQILKKHLPQQKTGTAPIKVVKPTSAIFSRHLNQQVRSPDVSSHPGVNLMYSSDLAYQNPLPHASAQVPVQLPPDSSHIPPPTTPYQQPLPIIEHRYEEYIMTQDQEFQTTCTTPSMSYESALKPTQSTQRNVHPYSVVSQQRASFINYGEGLQPQPQNYSCGSLSQFSCISQKAHDSEVGIPHFNPHSELFSGKGQNSAYNSHPHGVPIMDDEALTHFSPVERRGTFMHFPVSEGPVLSLPHALPMASFIDEESSTNSSENRVPADEANVIDKVTTMGFRRDMVKVTVKKLKENGQSVDLNAVLDKLMT